MIVHHKVFMLEDDNDIPRLVRHHLETAGYRVRTFSTGAHVLAESQRERPTSFVSLRSVDLYVRKLREKIERDPENPRYLRTVRGAGYRFEVPK